MFDILDEEFVKIIFGLRGLINMLFWILNIVNIVYDAMALFIEEWGYVSLKEFS